MKIIQWNLENNKYCNKKLQMTQILRLNNPKYLIYLKRWKEDNDYMMDDVVYSLKTILDCKDYFFGNRKDTILMNFSLQSNQWYNHMSSSFQ